MCGGGLQRNTEKPSRSSQYVLRITPIFKAKKKKKTKQYLFPCGILKSAQVYLFLKIASRLTFRATATTVVECFCKDSSHKV